jgi:histidine triad (HIT) family protein
VWATAQKVAKAIESAYETTILTIGINHGEPAGVPHLHVHLMPRFEGDGGGIIQSLPGVRQTTKEFGVVAEKIKKHIA